MNSLTSNGQHLSNSSLGNFQNQDALQAEGLIATACEKVFKKSFVKIKQTSSFTNEKWRYLLLDNLSLMTPFDHQRTLRFLASFGVSTIYFHCINLTADISKLTKDAFIFLDTSIFLHFSLYDGSYLEFYSYKENKPQREKY